MASNFILTRCDGEFGCNCPAIRHVIVAKKRKKALYMREYHLKRREEKRNGAESS